MSYQLRPFASSPHSHPSIVRVEAAKARGLVRGYLPPPCQRGPGPLPLLGLGGGEEEGLGWNIEKALARS